MAKPNQMWLDSNIDPDPELTAAVESEDDSTLWEVLNMAALNRGDVDAELFTATWKELERRGLITAH